MVGYEATSFRGEFHATLSSAYVRLRTMVAGGDVGGRDDLVTRVGNRLTMMAAATSAWANPVTAA